MPPKRKGAKLEKNDEAPATGSQATTSPTGAAPPPPPPGSARQSTRRRSGGVVPPPAPNPQPHGDPLAEQPAKKRRKERVTAGGGGTTSAAAAAPPPEDEDLLSPLSPGSLGAAPSKSRTGDHLMEAVVKVFTTHSEPNFSLPWQRKRQFSSSGSGFVIAGRRLLTNAHCVDHHTQVKVKRRGSDAKYVAQVLAIGVECDIALLTVEDESFWQGLEAVQFGGLPRLQDSVTVIGYPIGGDTISVTSGVVSRIEVTGYAHGAAELLGIQVDAAINSGNSGGPAFNDRGECVGIAFQSLKNEDTENISYIIPTPVIQHFINDYERNGCYTGFPSLGIEWQKMESPVLRGALGMQPGQRGVLVRRIEPTSPASQVLQQGDVVLSFDGVDIGSDGTVPFRSGERISFTHLISQKYAGGEAKLRILHDRAVREVTVQLRSPRRLIPVHINNRPPSYYILGGLVFTPVTVPLLRSEYGKEFDYEAPVKLLDKMLHAQAENGSQQVVVLSQVLAADANVGYEDIVNTQVVKVNGQPVNNLGDLVAAVEGSTGQYLEFSLEYNQLVILDKAAAQAATADILTQHCIAHDRSEDLRADGGAAAAEGSRGAAAADGGVAVGGAAEGGENGGTRGGTRGGKRAKKGSQLVGEEQGGAVDAEAGAAEGGLPGAGARPAGRTRGRAVR